MSVNSFYSAFHLLSFIHTGEVPTAAVDLEWEVSSFIYAEVPAEAIASTHIAKALQQAGFTKDLAELASHT